MLVLLMGGFMTYAVEMSSCGMIFLPSTITFDTGVQASNLKGCNVGTANGSDLCRAPLK
jgi:hypothetical protein